MADRVDQLLGVVALAAADRMREATEAELGHGGAAPAALIHLDTHPGEPLEGLRVALRISQPGAVRVVDRLVDADLVERRPGPDGRSRALHLTWAGKAAARRIRAVRAHALAELTAPLSPSVRHALEPVLERLAAALADDRPQALAVCRLCDRETCCGQTGLECPLQHTVRAA